jgi:hypothetical protein
VVAPVIVGRGEHLKVTNNIIRVSEWRAYIVLQARDKEMMTGQSQCEVLKPLLLVVVLLNM